MFILEETDSNTDFLNGAKLSKQFDVKKMYPYKTVVES